MADLSFISRVRHLVDTPLFQLDDQELSYEEQCRLLYRRAQTVAREYGMFINLFHILLLILAPFSPDCRGCNALDAQVLGAPSRQYHRSAAFRIYPPNYPIQPEHRNTRTICYEETRASTDLAENARF